jgi:hypothetical protein
VNAASRDGNVVAGRVLYFERILLMLMTIAIVLIVLWLLGLVTSSTMGGLIHALLVIAIIIILVRFIQGRRVL